MKESDVLDIVDPKKYRCIVPLGGRTWVARYNEWHSIKEWCSRNLDIEKYNTIEHVDICIVEFTCERDFLLFCLSHEVVDSRTPA